ncbi:hypothetical protein ScPMuIL_004988 [Solemya velum]
MAAGDTGMLMLNGDTTTPLTDHIYSNTNSSVSCGTPTSDEYRFTNKSHSSHVLSGLKHLHEEKLLCDVTICVEGHEILCHKILLASFSPYFKTMFAGCLAESRQDKVTLSGIEMEMIKILIEYSYTSEIIINDYNVQSLLSASNLLEILPVKEACCSRQRYLQLNLDDSNCIGIHCFAEDHACESLQQKAKEYILSNFMNVCKEEEILKISHSKLAELLSDDNLNVDSEQSVFLAALRWMKYDIEKRQSHFHMILEHIRLPLICPYFLKDFVENESEIMQVEECKKLVNEAKTYQLLPDRRPELQTARTKLRNREGYSEVIVAVGGEDDKVILRSVETFDPISLKWSSLECLPFAISKHGLVASGNDCVYLAGGEFPDSTASSIVQCYNPNLNIWQKLGSMQVARSELGLSMLDGYMYAVGGWNGSSRLDSIERYDPKTNSWSFRANMKVALTSPAVASLGGQLYVMGGTMLEDEDGIGVVHCYDPHTDTWVDRAPMLIPRSGAAACILNGLIYIIGGWHASTENTNKVECYNPLKNIWVQRAPMNERRYRPGVAVVAGRIYVCGGEEGWDRYHDTVECYTPATDTWEIVGEMLTSRSWLSCVSLRVRKDMINPDNRIQMCTV